MLSRIRHWLGRSAVPGTRSAAAETSTAGPQGRTDAPDVTVTDEEEAPAATATGEDLSPALALMRGGDLAGAEARLRDDLQRWPHSAGVRHVLAVVLAQQGRAGEATDLLAAAVALAPDRADLRVDLGNVRRVAGDENGAAAHYRAAIDLDPTLAAAWSNLCQSLRVLGDWPGAVSAGRRAVEHGPGLADAHSNLGLALQATGELEAAEQALRRALDCHPGHADAWNNLGNVLADRGRAREACDAYERCLALVPAHRRAVSNHLLALHYRTDLDAGAVAEAHLREAPRLEAVQALPARAAGPGRPLRIGYLSADLRTHSVACFVEPVIAAHDRARVHVTAYASVAQPDAVSARIAAACDRWREVAALDDAALARRVREDGIDVLVDLGGHTAGSRLPVLAYRPAPLAGTWIGYPDTTGMRCVDFRVTDVVADPPGAEHLHAERLLRLDGGFLCYGAPADAPPAGPPPSLAVGAVTFGSFNNGAKLNEVTAALWAALLAEVPAARLLVKARQLDDAATREHFAGLFERAGIGRERLQLEGWRRDRADHLGRYAEVDIALDTLPYNGTTTTCEALWMGVPVLTLRGDRHAARVGASLLAAAGLEELVAADEAGFVAIGAALAGDAARLRELRAGLRARLADSSLMDARRCAAALEDGLEALLAAPGG